jgi:hypothetical protein
LLLLLLPRLLLLLNLLVLLQLPRLLVLQLQNPMPFICCRFISRRARVVCSLSQVLASLQGLGPVRRLGCRYLGGGVEKQGGCVNAGKHGLKPASLHYLE